MKRRLLVYLVCGFSLVLAVPQIDATPQDVHAAETIQVDLRAKGQPFPHFWEEMFGSGRAALALRESYRDDLREVKNATDFKYVRFHAIFHDEVGVYDEDASGKPIYNFSYVDQIYDGLLKCGVRPFVELSFMPKKLAAENDLHPFWYKPNVSPPKDYNLWGQLIEQFTNTLSPDTALMKFRNGILKFGTNPTWIFGPAPPRSRLIISYTTLPPAC